VKLRYAFMNDVQLVGWASVLMVAVLQIRHCPPALLAFAFLVQALNVYDLWLILGKQRRGAVLPWVLQNGARLLFIVLLYIAWKQNIHFRIFIFIDAASLLLIVWSLAEISRFLFYVFNTRALKWLRYNSFLVCYPLGVLIELAWMYKLYLATAFIFGKILLIALAFAYLFGFPYLFLHLFRSRRQKLYHE
jgi:very-long-chain (3R)-3-hydroxyacyl-CoA dehydratase